ncbi:hypothetical protein EVAR_54440_1 [Eumeta japonica]|uniref:Uncharacterized protein n=1 Tax=Eumeta variegata TaxID=151549 RepID=A0A4C1XI39_EUMVA|nr:hypothetical protein EVAR_54440_1 [Eumeta japonica]
MRYLPSQNSEMDRDLIPRPPDTWLAGTDRAVREIVPDLEFESSIPGWVGEQNRERFVAKSFSGNTQVFVIRGYLGWFDRIQTESKTRRLSSESRRLEFKFSSMSGWKESRIEIENWLSFSVMPISKNGASYSPFFFEDDLRERTKSDDRDGIRERGYSDGDCGIRYQNANRTQN